MSIDAMIAKAAKLYTKEANPVRLVLRGAEIYDLMQIKKGLKKRTKPGQTK